MSDQQPKTDFRSRFLVESVDALCDWIEARLRVMGADQIKQKRVLRVQREYLRSCRGDLISAACRNERDWIEQPD
jgi:hypothetical protein